MDRQTPVTFGSLLRELRDESFLTQEQLADAAGVSARSVSDLERGVNRTARAETARLLADALGLAHEARSLFMAAALGRADPATVLTVTRGVRPGSFAAATRTLPRTIASFIGRDRELGQLDEAVAANAADCGVVGIHAIGGMAGIGKTTFAIHAAHRLAERFPDGQFFLPLHAHTPGHQPVEPADALASLLMTAGVAAHHIPLGSEARAALWRDHLAGKQILLVLDDAAGHEQVRPLLPGTEGSLVLITSRQRLTALDDAAVISLDTLSPDEAAMLLARLAARPGLASGNGAAGDITRLCGYLPLAIGMLGRQLGHHPSWTPGDLASRLSAARDRLGLMQAENLSVAAAFDLSYGDLTPGQQQLFRRLGLVPGPDVDAYAAAALDGTSLEAAWRNLDGLYGQHLLTELAPGRYRLHDLLREHARTLAGRLDPGQDPEHVIARLLGYYQRTAALASARLSRRARSALASPPPTETTSSAVPALADRDQALAWARAERANLLACLDHVTSTSQPARIVALTAGVAALLRLDGPWAEAITRHITAARAAQQLGDRPGHANALNHLGEMQRLVGDYPAAAVSLEEALGIYRDLGDMAGQAGALNDLGTVLYQKGDYPQAARALEEARGIYRDLGDMAGQAGALTGLGSVRRLTENYPGAAGALEKALGIYRDLGDLAGQASAGTSLGVLLKETGDYPGAAQVLNGALGIYSGLGDRLGQASVLANLGRLQRAVRDYPAAARNLNEALTIYRDLGHQLGQANALSDLGGARRATGDYPGAALALKEALGIYRTIGDQSGEAEVLNETGTLHRVSGDLRKAESFHHEALSLTRQVGGSWDEAHALAGLSRCALSSGHPAEAAILLRQALEIFQRIGAAEAGEIADELQALPDARPATHGP